MRERGEGVYNQNALYGRGIDIFWNKTFLLYLDDSVDVGEKDFQLLGA